MSNLTNPQVIEFLTKPRHAVVATNKSNGVPQLSPVWYLYEQETIYVSVTTGTAKYHNLQRDPRLSICVDGGVDDYRYIVFYGTAKLIEPDEPKQAELRRRIIGHYHDDEASAQRYYDRVKVNPAAVIVLKPDKVVVQGFD